MDESPNGIDRRQRWAGFLAAVAFMLAALLIKKVEWTRWTSLHETAGGYIFGLAGSFAAFAAYETAIGKRSRFIFAAFGSRALSWGMTVTMILFGFVVAIASPGAHLPWTYWLGFAPAATIFDYALRPTMVWLDDQFRDGRRN